MSTNSFRHYGSDGLGLTILIAALVWFCDDMIFAAKVPFFRDLSTYTFPIKFSLATSLRAGELPLWDRHMAAGFPLMAAFQQGVFYPLNLVFYALPFFDAIRLTFFLHYMIAAAGAYFLCRQWQQPVYVAVIAAATFTFGGTIVSLSNLLNHFQTAVWLPWMVLCWERALAFQSWPRFLTVSIVSLCALLAGSPEMYLLSLGLLFLDGVRLQYQDRSVALRRIIGLLAASNVLVLLIGMVQFLPTLELLSHSRRDHAIPLAEATLWSLNPVNLVGLFFPDKEVDFTLPIGIRLFFSPGTPFLLSHYLGVLSLVAICSWFQSSSRKERFVTLAVIGGSVVLACGSYTPIYSYVFDTIPLLRAIRFPEKLFFFTYACLIFVIGRGLVAFHEATFAGRKITVMFVFSVLLLWLIPYALLRVSPDLLHRFAAHQVGDVSGLPSIATTHATILFHLERQIAITTALLLLLICYLRKWLSAPLFSAVLVAVAICDLGLVHKPFQFLLDPQATIRSNMLSPPPPSDPTRVFYYPAGPNLHPSVVSVFGRPPFEKATALNAENLLPNAGVMHGFDYFQEIDALNRQPYNDFLNFANLISPDARIKLLRALNVRYVITFRELKAAGLTLARQIPEQYSWLYEISQPAPRAYMVTSAITETQPAKILRMLSSKEFDPLSQVIIDRPSATAMNAELKGSAIITDYGNSRVTLKAATSVAAFLVLADSFYPGWKVFVDGKQSEILRANYFFRAVELSPGEHTIRFEYQPWSFAWGLRISLLTISLVFLVTVAQLVRTLGAERPGYALART